tara:strand:- start:38 stop:670 length:633 start_codon:yes stop_codon:yes gene_type:complete
MKNLKIITFALIMSFVTSVATAENRVGLNLAYMMFSGTGSETLRQSGAVTNYDESDEVLVPSLFIEVMGEQGIGFGVDYVPVAEIGSGVGADDDDAETSGSNNVSAEFSAHMTLYAIAEGPNGFYGKLGYVMADIDTTENLSTGDSYPDTDTDGYTIAVGKYFNTVNDLQIRGDLSYTDYDAVEIKSTGGSTVKADVESIAATVSFVKSF